jgi:large subunit ribosomal protein L5
LARFKEKYQTEVVPALMERFGYKNVMEVPKFDKVVLNIGVGEAVQDPKALEAAARDLEIISGQKPIITYAKKSVAAYKLRAGMAIGCKVTLRGERMYEFLDRLISIALPRIRDFRGVSEKSFDGRGNYSLGLREQLVFPEIEYDKIDKVRGLMVTIGTTAETDEEAYELLKLMGMPFRS